MGSIAGLIIGGCIAILCLFLTTSIGTFLPDLTTAQLDILKIFFMMLGLSSVFIGFMSRL